ncbi:hypothetical protein BaRGS_00018719 [Batillaria attramentaria]|uniref:G-protein coupled receptors family 1 profile domain-containing protein n=1 Tax=Batillaria attramentaria TaxID=370345 RepID=A0ABD0KS34_9CAEN
MELTKDCICLALYAVGLVGNTISSTMWRSLKKEVSIARSLMILSVSDLLCILLLSVSSILWLSDVQCASSLVEVAGDVFYIYSCNMTVNIAVQRYLAIAHPFSARRLCTEVRQRIAMVALAMWTVAEVAPFTFGHAVSYIECIGNRPLVSASLEFAEGIVHLHVVLNFVKVVLLILFNSLLLHAVCRMETISTAGMSRENRRVRVKSTAMVICVSTVTLISYCFIQVNNFLVLTNWRAELKYEEQPIGQDLMKIMFYFRDVSIAFNVSVNVFIYSFLSIHFRSALKEKCRRLFVCCKNTSGAHTPIEV